MGGSKKVTVGYKYSMGQHQVLVHGPIDHISRLTFDEKIAWQGRHTGGTITVDAESLFGGDDAEGGVSGQIDIMMGNPAQTQNSYLQSMLGSVIPAFRGVVSAVFKQFYFGNSAYLKPLAFRASRVHVKDDGETQWYDEKSEIGINPHTYFGLTDYFDQGQAPFGNIYPGQGDSSVLAGLKYPVPNSVWLPEPYGTAEINLTKSINIDPIPPWITISGRVENAVSIYLNDELIYEFNPDDDDVTGFPVFKVYVTGDRLLKGINVFRFNCRDEPEPFGFPRIYDRTYFAVKITGAAQEDMNPIHMLRECATSKFFGLGLADVDINNDAFTIAADQLFDEEMGMSLLWDSDSMGLDEFMDEICRHIDASHFVDQNGLLTVKLIRDDYDVEDLITLDTSNVISVDNAASTPSTELVNAVTGIYWDPATGKNASVSVSDPALVQMQGRIKSTTIQYPGFTSPDVVARKLSSDLRSLSNSLFSCTIIVNRVPEGLNIGEPFIFSWPELDQYNTVMRVADIDWGDGRNNDIRISCTQDVFAIPSFAVVSPSPGWEAPNLEAAPSPYRAVMELPYYDLVQGQGQAVIDAIFLANPDVGFLGAAVQAPSGNSINAEIFVDAGAGFASSGYFDFCPALTFVDALELDTETVEISNFTDVESFDSIINRIGIVDNELIVITSVDSGTNVATLKRAVQDSQIAVHDAGSRCLIWDDAIGTDTTEYVAGESLDVRILPVTAGGQLGLQDAPTDTVEMIGRAYRPFPPQNITFNSEYFPDELTGAVLIEWADRNRLQQTGGTQIGFYDSSITREPDTTTTVELLDIDNVVIDSATGITGLSTTLTPLISGDYTYRIFTERDGLESAYPFEHSFIFTGALARFAIPLTYDEKDSANTVSLTRLGAAPWITPNGFLGDGYTARYRVENADIPAWVKYASREITLHASVQVYRGSRHATRDVIVSLCEDNSTANPKLELCVVSDALEVTQNNLAIRSYTSSMQTKRLCRGSWKYGFRFPDLLDAGNKVRPQALLFIDADTLLITGHYADTKSRAYVYDLATMSVSGQFDFPTPYVHVASAAYRASDSTYWFGDYATGALLQVDLTASLSAGTASITLTYDASAIVGFGSIDWINVSGTNYLLAAEYATSGTRYLYVVNSSHVTNGGTFAVADRYKRFQTGARRMQGVCFDSGKLFVTMNSLIADAGTPGRIQRFDILTAIASTSDGATITPEFNWFAPSQYVEDLDFHPSTGECWTSTEGLSSAVSDDGWLAMWHTQLSTTADANVPVNHVTCEYDGAGQLTVKMNNQLFEQLSWTPTITPAVLSIGGPPTATAGQTNGFCVAAVRNIVVQNEPMDSTQYADAISGVDEVSTLTAYNVTVTNPGGESTTTGWTNETGSIANRATAPNPHNGSSYFFGGANLQTIARQRFSLATVTGLSTSAIDAAAAANQLWARVNWYQNSFTSDTDTGSIGIRYLDAVPTLISLTYSGLINISPQQTSDWMLRGLPVLTPSGARNVDLVYRSDRSNGTNNDTYVDDITLTIYQQ